MSGRRQTAKGLVPRHTTWGVLFLSLVIATLAGFAVGFVIGWVFA